MENKKQFRSYLPLTFLIGFGFFTIGMMDPLYDSYVQIFLSKYIKLKSVIGLIMSLDNLLALFLIPLVSVWSDHTETPFGRRMPWIVVLLPVSAILFAYIPYAAESSLFLLISVLLLLNVFKQSARGPVVALMPDIVPGVFRSQANGVINTMGNIAAIVGTLFIARLMDVNIILPFLGATKNRLAFPVASVFVILAVILLSIFIKERKQSLHEPSDRSADVVVRVPFIKSISIIFTSTDKSALFVLVSLFFWFVGYQGVMPFITQYSIDTFGLSGGRGPIAMGMVGISSALSAIPMGYAAGKWGRKRMIRISLVAIALVCLCFFFLVPAGALFGFVASQLTFAFWGLAFCFGVFWISVIANSFPMLWQMAHHHNMGVYTGLYYTFSQLAAIVAPSLAGAVIDRAGFPSMFLFCSVSLLIAWVTMGFVTTGEKNDEPVS